MVFTDKHKWQTILAIDFERRATETYSANFPDVDVCCASVADELERLPYADIVLGGPPCQPHSLAGKRKGTDLLATSQFRKEFQKNR